MGCRGSDSRRGLGVHASVRRRPARRRRRGSPCAGVRATTHHAAAVGPSRPDRDRSGAPGLTRRRTIPVGRAGYVAGARRALVGRGAPRVEVGLGSQVVEPIDLADPAAQAPRRGARAGVPPRRGHRGRRRLLRHGVHAVRDPGWIPVVAHARPVGRDRPIRGPRRLRPLLHGQRRPVDSRRRRALVSSELLGLARVLEGAGPRSGRLRARQRGRRAPGSRRASDTR